MDVVVPSPIGLSQKELVRTFEVVRRVANRLVR